MKTRLTLSFLLAAAPVAAQDLGSKVRSLLNRADKAPLERVWEIGRRVSALGDKEEILAQAIHGQLDKVRQHGRLAAATALQEITDGTEFGQKIFAALEPVLKGKTVESIRAALSLASRQSFFSRKIQRELRSVIRPMVQSDLTNPTVRVAAAKALWRVGTNDEQRSAKRVLEDFTKSTDRRLQVMGALAMADINVDSESPAWAILKDISDEPTADGQLARSYLRIENQRRTFDSTLRQLSSADLPGDRRSGSDAEFGMIKEILARVAQRHVRGDKITKQQMLENAAKGLLRSLDRHSAFFNSDEFQKFFFDLNPEYGGIGAFVDFDKDDIFSIVRPIYSGPAYEANLRSGDKILEVDDWETIRQTSKAIIARLKGKPGTKVKVKIFRRGWSKPKTISIVRRKIQVPSVNHEMLPADVGYVEVITFGGQTAEELTAALLDLKRRGAKAMVLDLRNNSGGYLEIAKAVVELFVKGKKLVVYTKGRDVAREDYRTGGRAILADMPLAVLVNGYSASASEITAGALQDHGRAVIIGERSFGKGSVQSLLPLSSDRPEAYKDGNHNRQFDPWESYTDRNDNGKYDIGPRLKLTVAHYFLPSGRCVHKRVDMNGKVLNPDWGVTPDKVLELREMKVKDRWKEAVISDFLEGEVFKDYVTKHMPKNKTLFVELAEGDDGEWSRYPEFDAFYKGLDTKLARDDVRRWLRYRIRDEVSDLRGKAFPGGRAVGDFQEDAQLQEAVRTVLLELKQDIRKIKAYAKTLRIKFGEDKKKAKEKAVEK